MVIDRFREIVENRHKYAQEWKKKTGKKVLGYFCTYMPEEIVYAAGILPVRVMGGREPAAPADRYIPSMYCPFCHDCLTQGLKGRYDYLDGLVHTHGCMHIYQTFFSWQKAKPVPFSYSIYLPYNLQSPPAKDCLIEEFRQYKHALEEWTGETIARTALNEAIEIYNTNRRLMKEIWEMRKEDNPPISGAEAMEIVLSGIYMDKKEHNQLLKELLKELLDRTAANESKVRLMLIGSENDDTDLIRLTESLGGIVVIDDHCNGTRYFWTEVVPEEDPIIALANKCVNKPSCPVTGLEGDSRFEHILKLAKDYNIQGAMLVQQSFCDTHEYDLAIIKQLLEKNNINTLWLELNVTTPVGQFQTRIEAFLETFLEDLV